MDGAKEGNPARSQRLVARRHSGILSSALVFPLAVSLLAPGCASKSDSSDLSTCSPPSGSPWVPDVPGVSASNHNSSISVSQNTTTVASAALNGFHDPVSGGRLVSVTIPMTDDLGPLGSLSLSAQVTGVPSSLQGGFHPLLVSLNDGTHEYINLALSGGADCAGAGFFTASGDLNTSCVISAPSAYQDLTHWIQHQMRISSETTTDNESFSVFPTCNWANGSAGPGATPDCAFNSTFFVGTPARLKFGAGVNYTAKYFIMADRYISITGYTGTLQVTAVKKTDASSTLGGAVDVNIVLVGSQNVNDSRTPKGQQNLNLLMSSVLSVYTQSQTDPVSHASYSPGVKIGKINVIEWGCDAGGDAYATVDPFAPEGDPLSSPAGAIGPGPGDSIAAGSSALPAALAGNSINIFLIQQFTDASVLGIDGSIGGSLVNGSPSSGMLVATLGRLAAYNPDCTLSSCPVTSQETDFVQMGPTIAHEMGHFFGLNHPSQNPSTVGGPVTHDLVLDTPAHTASHDFGDGSGAVLESDYIQLYDTNPYLGTGNTCNQACPGYNSGYTHLHSSGTPQQFCPAVFECGFNHLMWWQGKAYTSDNSQSDGNMISLDSSNVINYSPFVY